MKNNVLQTSETNHTTVQEHVSTFGLLWSSMRNALGSDRVQKLVTVYRHYNL